MKLITWNVNGLRACINKGFLDFFQETQADILCLQEIKLSEGQLDLQLPGYTQYYNFAEKKGYSGTAIFTKITPQHVLYGMGIPRHDHEGRVITLDMGDFYLLTVYTPNAQSELARLSYRMDWDDCFRNYVSTLNQSKPVLFCGDLNVAHQEIDLANPESNRRSAGFTDEEREKFSMLLDAGFTDSFRWFYPDKTKAYTWWSYRTRARSRNVGWRIDYFCCSRQMESHLVSTEILDEVMGSDHCPVQLELSLAQL